MAQYQITILVFSCSQRPSFRRGVFLFLVYEEWKENGKQLFFLVQKRQYYRDMPLGSGSKF